jgi:hypothetical protein
MSPQPPIREPGWAQPFSVDLILKVLNVTFLHPFVAWMIPLCMRAQVMAWDHTAMYIAIGYASSLTLLFILNVFNKKIAYTKARTVDLGEEVIVITGGARGLGLLLAEVYGMRGATVAVLDIVELEAGEARGVTAYKCDVGDSAQVARVAAQIEKEVWSISYLICNLLISHSSVLLQSLSTMLASSWANLSSSSLSRTLQIASTSIFLHTSTP